MMKVVEWVIGGPSESWGSAEVLRQVKEWGNGICQNHIHLLEGHISSRVSVKLKSAGRRASVLYLCRHVGYKSTRRHYKLRRIIELNFLFITSDSSGLVSAARLGKWVLISHCCFILCCMEVLWNLGFFDGYICTEIIRH